MPLCSVSRLQMCARMLCMCCAAGNSVLAVQVLIGTILCVAVVLMATKGFVYDNFAPKV